MRADAHASELRGLANRIITADMDWRAQLMKSPRTSTSQIDTKIAARIQSARHDLQLEADWVADRIGVTEDVYRALEAGELYIRATIIARLSIVLNQKISWFYADCPGQDMFTKVGL